MSEIRFLIAPTEPPNLRAIGQVSMVTEHHGCDIIGVSTTAIVGFQRKTPEDFLSSLSDGRLAKQIGQIHSSSILNHAILILEGAFHWTSDGQLLSSYNNGFQRSHLTNLLLQLQIQGLLLVTTDGLTDTISTVNSVMNSLSKTIHTSLLRRPKQSLTSWGTKNSSNYAQHILQSFDGIGPTTALAMFTTFGRIPLKWDVTETQLQTVPGIGKTLARSLKKALE